MYLTWFSQNGRVSSSFIVWVKRLHWWTPTKLIWSDFETSSLYFNRMAFPRRKQMKCLPTMCGSDEKLVLKDSIVLTLHSCLMTRVFCSTCFTKWKVSQARLIFKICCGHCLKNKVFMARRESFAVSLDHALLNLLTSPQVCGDSWFSIICLERYLFRNRRFFLSCFLSVFFFSSSVKYFYGLYQLWSSSNIRLSWNFPFCFIKNKPNRLQDSLPREVENLASINEFM